MRIETRKLSEIKPYPNNARKIPDAAVEKVAMSLREYGWQQPIVLDSENVIIVGHVRWMAARKNGWTDAPVHIAADLTPAQAKAYRLMDNRSHDETAWEENLLGLELAELRALDLDLSLTGFGTREIDALLLDRDDRCDEAPPVPEVAVTRPGDLWLCGPHRVLCGDSTSSDAIERLCGGVVPHLMVTDPTDPPYGVEYDPHWRAAAGINQNDGKMGKVSKDGRADWHDAWALFRGAVAYVWHAGRYASTVQESLERAGLKVVSQIIWTKDRFALSCGDYHWQHEPCWYAVREGLPHQWTGARDQSTVWQIRRADDSGHGHGTQKPVECMRRPIVNNSNPGQAVYHPFLGSGTTLIAAGMTGRICYGVEIDPAYADVIVQRWQTYTGKEATLEGTRATFEQVKWCPIPSCGAQIDWRFNSGRRSIWFGRTGLSRTWQGSGKRFNAM